jgi:hypothetical protein
MSDHFDIGQAHDSEHEHLREYLHKLHSNKEKIEETEKGGEQQSKLSELGRFKVTTVERTEKYTQEHEKDKNEIIENQEDNGKIKDGYLGVYSVSCIKIKQKYLTIKQGKQNK